MDEATLREVRRRYREGREDYDYALVSLDLAVLLLEQGRSREVRELARYLRHARRNPYLPFHGSR